MKHHLVIEFDDDSIDTLGILTKVDSLTVDSIPCNLSSHAFTEGVNTHTFFFHPFKMNLCISCSVDHKLTLQDYLETLTITQEQKNHENSFTRLRPQT